MLSFVIRFFYITVNNIFSMRRLTCVLLCTIIMYIFIGGCLSFMDSDSSEGDNGNYVRINRVYPAYLCLV